MDVQVPAGQLLGTEGEGVATLEACRDRAIAALCAEAVGAMSVLNSATLEYSRARKQFGVALGTFQVLQHRMVDMFIALEESISLTQHLNLSLAAREPNGSKLWASGALAELSAPEIATWLLLLAPAVLLSAFSIPGKLPLLASLAFQHTILTCGLIGAVWSGIASLRAGPATRYGRVALCDLALVAAGVGTGEPSAVAGALVLILTHLVAAPILLQSPRQGLGSPRRLVWLALCGLPPSPAFWGRFLILEACVAFGYATAVPCVVAGGLVTVAAVVTVARGEPGSGAPAPHHRVVAAWVVALVVLAVGLLPVSAVHLVFGPSA
ncbi:MAG: acyl-CoA dehydrogenase family protein [Candidatus Dormibacteria bacterium]